MSSPVATELRWDVPRGLRPVAAVAAWVARAVVVLPPVGIHRVLTLVTGRATEPSAAEVLEWRNAVNSVSKRCAGNGCLQRSVAIVLLGALHGRAPVWCTGFRLEPFTAHAWVEVDDVPIDEPEIISSYTKVLTMTPRRRRLQKGKCP